MQLQADVGLELLSSEVFPRLDVQHDLHTCLAMDSGSAMAINCGHSVWLGFLQHSSWVPRGSISNTMLPGAQVECHFCCILLTKLVTQNSPDWTGEELDTTSYCEDKHAHIATEELGDHLENYWPWSALWPLQYTHPPPKSPRFIPLWDWLEAQDLPVKSASNTIPGGTFPLSVQIHEPTRFLCLCCPCIQQAEDDSQRYTHPKRKGMDSTGLSLVHSSHWHPPKLTSVPHLHAHWGPQAYLHH